MAIARGLAALAVFASPLLLPASAEALSCVRPSEVTRDAEHVFVGTISDVRGASVRFDVIEVWKGGDLAPQVWVERDPEMDIWLPFAVDGELPDGFTWPTEQVVAVHDDFKLGVCGLWSLNAGIEYGVPGERDPRPPVELTGAEPDAEGEPEVAVGVEPEGPSAAGPIAAGGVGAFGAAAVAVLLWRRRRS